MIGAIYFADKMESLRAFDSTMEAVTIERTMPMPIRWRLEHGNPLLLPGEHAHQRNKYLVVQRHEQYHRHRRRALEHRRRNHEGAADLVVHQYALLGEERHWLLKNDVRRRSEVLSRSAQALALRMALVTQCHGHLQPLSNE